MSNFTILIQVSKVLLELHLFSVSRQRPALAKILLIKNINCNPHFNQIKAFKK
jgi:hypothetical protein